MRKILTIAMVLIFIVVSGCSSTKKKNEELQKENAQLKSQLEAVQSKTEEVATLPTSSLDITVDSCTFYKMLSETDIIFYIKNIGDKEISVYPSDFTLSINDNIINYSETGTQFDALRLQKNQKTLAIMKFRVSSCDKAYLYYNGEDGSQKIDLNVKQE